MLHQVSRRDSAFSFRDIGYALRYGARLQPWRWLVGFHLALSTATRCALLWKTGSTLDPTVGTVASSLLVGVGFDIVAASFLFLPLVVALAVLPLGWRRYRSGRLLTLSGMAAWTMTLLFIAVSEWIFWDEFGARFNFIAVDYLVYTHEVISNLWQSYPVAWILLALACLSAVVVWWQRRAILGEPQNGLRWQVELLATACVLALPIGSYYGVNASAHQLFTNRYANEIAGNGVYEFFHAFNSAELDFDQFYPTLPRGEAFQRARDLLAPRPHQHYATHNPLSLARANQYSAARPLNVVLITLESLSAEYLARFGDRQNLTPNLNRLASQSLFFTNFYATGTRTVRGLEALSLSIPPTPGESIIKRPRNTKLNTLGQIFKSAGYDVRFVYGGYARFDSMGEFFGGNGYQVIDRTDIPEARIHHENAWGVADEDLFTQALLESGKSTLHNRPFFTHIMTTSNHRPYTFPNGRIDLPSGHSGRAGAVKYTDWAIGDFIARAGGEPWFRDTVFVIVADHCASSAGKTALPLERYRIPLLIYAPGIIPPQEVPDLASQIDVAPTILGLLRMSYNASFFGRDLLEPSVRAPFAFISTYQELGFLRDGQLVELAPNAKPRVSDANVPGHAPRGYNAQEQVRDAIALYQVAADEYRSGALRYVATPNATISHQHVEFAAARK